MKIKKNKIIKFIIIFLILLIIYFIINIIYQNFQKNKFKKMLIENDSNNYELTEIVNGVETKIFVRDKILLSGNSNSRIWVNENISKRVAFDEEYKTAIIDENDENLKVNSLNYTYINDFFENSDQKFKYVGEDKKFYEISFKEKQSKKITIFYINKETKIIEKMIQNSGNFELVTEFKVKKNSVSKDEVELPNLEGYRAYDSSTSNPDTNSDYNSSTENNTINNSINNNLKNDDKNITK